MADGYFAWDGFLPVASTLSGVVNGSVSQDFDSGFFLISEAVNGDAVGFDYDNDGLLIQAGSLSLSRDSASGLLAGTTLGVVSESIDYNAFAEPAARQVSVDGNPFFGVDFARDKLGRITELTETTPGTGTKILAYRYDPAGRLVEVRQGGMPIETYTFDANSNRIQSTTAAGTIDYDYDDQDRLIEATGPTGATTYAYTDAGELQSRTGPGGTTTYDYDAIGNLRAVTLPDGTQITYLIDGLDRRVGKKVNDTLVQGWLYRDLLNPVAELDGQGNVIARFVYGERPNVPAYMIRDGKTYRIVSDHLGSPRLVIDTDTGEVVQRMDYNTFGKVIQDTNRGFQPFGFAGGLYDPDTGLVRFGARDYDPEVGRWTAKDPIKFAGGDSNLYGYVLTDPVNLIDPTGLICFDFDQFVNDIRDNRFDLEKTAATLGLTLGIGTMPKAAAELRSFGMPKSEINPITSQLSRLTTRTGNRFFRVIGRTVLGVAASTLTTLALVAEGGFDLGVETRAAIEATSFGECECK